MTRLFLCLGLMAGLLWACGDDDSEDQLDCTQETVTYDTDILPIINRSCGTVGCHNQDDPTDAPLDYRTYNGMLTPLQGGINSRVAVRVLDQMTMPPDTVPDSKKLSSADRELFRCWLENGFPEN